MDKEKVQYILGVVDYKEGHHFHVGEMEGGRLYLQHQYQGKDSKTGEARLCKGRKWYLSEHMTPSEVVQTAFKAALTNEEHECRENFTYRGKAIFGPHYNIDKLFELCATDEHEEHRL